MLPIISLAVISPDRSFRQIKLLRETPLPASSASSNLLKSPDWLAGSGGESGAPHRGNIAAELRIYRCIPTSWLEGRRAAANLASRAVLRAHYQAAFSVDWVLGCPNHVLFSYMYSVGLAALVRNDCTERPLMTLAAGLLPSLWRRLRAFLSLAGAYLERL